MKGKTRQYEADGIVVEFEAARCIHAAECVHGLPDVFDADARPWIQPEHASADAIAEVVHRCPTGALRYQRTDGAPPENPAEENTVRLVADGPLYVTGRLRLADADGEAVEQTRVALCRCGDSANKPFCDNAHKASGFSDAGHCVEDRLGEGKNVDDDALTIRMAKNGPVLVEGPVTVIAADGSSSTGKRAAFCRCGASKTKPYCDGTHSAIGFEAD